MEGSRRVVGKRFISCLREEAQEGFAYSSSVSLEFGYLLFNGPKVLSWSHRMVWEGVDSKR